MKNSRKKAALIGGLSALLAASSAGCMLSDPNDPNYMFHQQNQNPNYYQQPQEPQAPGAVFVGSGAIFSGIGAYKGNPNAAFLGDSLINAGAAMNGRNTVIVNNDNRSGPYPREYVEIDHEGNIRKVVEKSPFLKSSYIVGYVPQKQ